MTIDLNAELWGYDGYYTGNRFHLKLKSRPQIKGKLKGLRIVVDPGHSPDPGAVGPTGLQEKDANLAIALNSRIYCENGALMSRSRAKAIHRCRCMSDHKLPIATRLISSFPSTTMLSLME